VALKAGSYGGSGLTWVNVRVTWTVGTLTTGAGRRAGSRTIVATPRVGVSEDGSSPRWRVVSRNARTMAVMLCSRLAGSFSRVLRTIASSSGGISGRSREGGAGGSWSCLFKIAACVLARNGTVPVSIS